jgi:hypothetical protein
MLSRRLTLAAFAAVFAASSSLAMLQQGTRPASADQDDHWRRSAHHQRNDHDRDDRRWNRNHNNGNHAGWYNGNGNRRHLDRDGRKVHVDPWRDRR